MTTPVERALGGVGSVRSLRSMSMHGMSVVTLEFPYRHDMRRAETEVSAALEAVDLPARRRPGEVIRLRVVCATVITFAPLVLDDHTLHVLAWDGITLSQVEAYTGEVAVGPGNRVEFLIRRGWPGPTT